MNSIPIDVVIHEIIPYLHMRELVVLEMTCKKIQLSKLMWKSLCERDFHIKGNKEDYRYAYHIHKISDFHITSPSRFQQVALNLMGYEKKGSTYECRNIIYNLNDDFNLGKDIYLQHMNSEDWPCIPPIFSVYESDFFLDRKCDEKFMIFIMELVRLRKQAQKIEKYLKIFFEKMSSSEDDTCDCDEFNTCNCYKCEEEVEYKYMQGCIKCKILYCRRKCFDEHSCVTMRYHDDSLYDKHGGNNYCECKDCLKMKNSQRLIDNHKENKERIRKMEKEEQEAHDWSTIIIGQCSDCQENCTAETCFTCYDCGLLFHHKYYMWEIGDVPYDCIENHIHYQMRDKCPIAKSLWDTYKRGKAFAQVCGKESGDCECEGCIFASLLKITKEKF